MDCRVIYYVWVHVLCDGSPIAVDLSCRREYKSSLVKCVSESISKIFLQKKKSRYTS